MTLRPKTSRAFEAFLLSAVEAKALTAACKKNHSSGLRRNWIGNSDSD